MLSAKVIENAQQAEHYFSQDNYYTTEEGFEQSAWAGKGAAALGLSGSRFNCKMACSNIGTKALGTRLTTVAKASGLGLRPAPARLPPQLLAVSFVFMAELVVVT